MPTKISGPVRSQPKPKSTIRPSAQEPVDASWLQMLADISPAGIYRTDAHGACLWVNDQWSQMTGRKPEQALGDGWTNAIHPEDRARLWKEWQAFPKSGASAFINEYRYLRPDGSVRWILSRATPFRDAKGQIEGYIGVSVDVSEMRAARAAIKKNGASAAMDLSKREREVTGLLAAGKTNKQVASQLGISVRTAEAHRARIMRKLRLGSVAALVRYALQSGLVNE